MFFQRHIFQTDCELFKFSFFDDYGNFFHFIADYAHINFSPREGSGRIFHGELDNFENLGSNFPPLHPRVNTWCPNPFEGPSNLLYNLSRISR